MAGEGAVLNVSVNKAERGLGFSLVGGENDAPGVYISAVLDGGAIDVAGLKSGDLLLKIGGKDVSTSTHDEVVELFRDASDVFEVQVRRPSPKDLESFLSFVNGNAELTNAEGSNTEVKEQADGRDRLNEARDAYEKGDANLSKKIHEELAGAAPEEHQTGAGQYVKAAVFGGLDGIVTTFSVVASVAGANLTNEVVLIMGIANLLGDGVSMAVGEYMSEHSEQAYITHERNRELWEMENYPEGEINEMIDLYEEQGIAAEDAKEILSTMAKYKSFFVDHMMVHELDMMPPDDPGWGTFISAAVMFSSFVGFGLIPLLPYICLFTVDFSGKFDPLFLLACILVGLALILLGVAKSKFSPETWYGSAFRVFLSGAFAAFIAWIVGYALSHIVSANCV